MNCRLLLLRLYLPSSLKRRQLLELYHRTVRAFGCEFGSEGISTLMGCRSHRRLLKAYAAFTGEQARIAMGCGTDPGVLSEQLRLESREMGQSLRKRLRLRTYGEFRGALRLIYRALGIDLRASACGEVLVRRCFFSRFYTGSACRLISALDDGLVEGLSGGGRLHFSHRLTEGASRCRGVIKMPKEDT